MNGIRWFGPLTIFVAEPLDLLAGLFAKGNKRAVKAREWAERVMVPGQVAIEAAPGSTLDTILQSAKGKDWLEPAKEQELMKIVKATLPSGKPGAKMVEQTKARIQGVVWWRAHEPGISKRKMARMMGIDYGRFKTFWRRSEKEIDRLTGLLSRKAVAAADVLWTRTRSDSAARSAKPT
jgi:hypothetical protein